MPQTQPRHAHDCYRALAAPDRASRPWLVTATRTVSHGELKQRIEAVAALLAERGIGIGERVVLASRDDAEVAMLFVALVCCGATAVNLDPDTGDARAAALIDKADPALLLLDPALAEKWRAREGARPVLDIVPPAPGGLLARLRGKTAPPEGLRGELARLTPRPPSADIDPETLAYILFTSGTTDQPKGVSISHRALFAHLGTLQRRFGYDPGCRILNTLMLSHADGMIQGPVMAFYTGATVLRPLAFEVTRIEALLDVVYRLRITHMVAVPTMLALILRLGLDQRDAFQGGDFRLLISCGAHLEPALWEGIESSFQVPLVNVYGLTETVVGGVFSGPDARTRMPGSIGMPEDCELKIVDEAGAPVEPGATGELLMRGDLLMSGYYGEPALTAEVLRDGWLHTGDIARIDADGRYWIVGRRKNIIIRGGYNIHPEEITQVLQAHPAVREAVTLGLPDPVWGETVAALVVADGVTPQALLAHCQAQLEPRKLPSRIERVDRLPRGRSGKVQLAQAAQLLTGRAAVADASAETPADRGIEARLLQLAATCFKAAPGSLALHATPRDVPGWDSLAHMEFVSALEAEFEVSLSARDILALDRLDKALQWIVPGR